MSSGAPLYYSDLSSIVSQLISSEPLDPRLAMTDMLAILQGYQATPDLPATTSDTLSRVRVTCTEKDSLVASMKEALPDGKDTGYLIILNKEDVMSVDQDSHWSFVKLTRQPDGRVTAEQTDSYVITPPEPVLTDLTAQITEGLKEAFVESSEVRPAQSSNTQPRGNNTLCGYLSVLSIIRDQVTDPGLLGALPDPKSITGADGVIDLVKQQELFEWAYKHAITTATNSSIPDKLTKRCQLMRQELTKDKLIEKFNALKNESFKTVLMTRIRAEDLQGKIQSFLDTLKHSTLPTKNEIAVHFGIPPEANLVGQIQVAVEEFYSNQVSSINKLLAALENPVTEASHYEWTKATITSPLASAGAPDGPALEGGGGGGPDPIATEEQIEAATEAKDKLNGKQQALAALLTEANKALLGAGNRLLAQAQNAIRIAPSALEGIATALGADPKKQVDVVEATETATRVSREIEESIEPLEVALASAEEAAERARVADARAAAERDARAEEARAAEAREAERRAAAEESARVARAAQASADRERPATPPTPDTSRSTPPPRRTSSSVSSASGAPNSAASRLASTLSEQAAAAEARRRETEEVRAAQIAAAEAATGTVSAPASSRLDRRPSSSASSVGSADSGGSAPSVSSAATAPARLHNITRTQPRSSAKPSSSSITLNRASPLLPMFVKALDKYSEQKKFGHTYDEQPDHSTRKYFISVPVNQSSPRPSSVKEASNFAVSTRRVETVSSTQQLAEKDKKTVARTMVEALIVAKTGMSYTELQKEGKLDLLKTISVKKVAGEDDVLKGFLREELKAKGIKTPAAPEQTEEHEETSSYRP